MELGDKFMSQKVELSIIVDNRERKLMSLLDKSYTHIKYEAKQLDIADVVISEDVAVERKEGFDLISSIMDNRLFEQLMRLKDTYANPLLILEGFNDTVLENTGMRLSSIYGAMSKIACSWRIPIIPTRNLDDTALLIERIAYREQAKEDTLLLSRKAPKEMNLDERRSFIIEGLVDIGPKKAKTLVEFYETPYQVFKAIKKTEITYTRTGNPKGLNGPLSDLQGFGWKFVEKNKTVLFGGAKPKEKKKDPQKTIDDI